MKRIFLLILSLCLTVPLFAINRYTFDLNHSSVLFHINHFGFSNPSGKWLVRGQLNFDEKNIENSQVVANLKVANIVTGIEELDKELRGATFFNTDKFPTATFVSEKVEKTGSKTAKVYGTLNVHGVSKPIVLNVTLNSIGENPISKKMTAGFSATTELKRSDFGITTLLPGLSDLVMIEIEVEAFK